MIEPKTFVEALGRESLTFYAGVPDSLLKPILSYVQDHVPSDHHWICANEGNALAVAVGYHLATGRIPVVYLQNSGLGNAVNPLTSLTDPQVYGMPALLLIGWRGEPGVKDEPQHIKQGAITPALLDVLGVDYVVLSTQMDVVGEQLSCLLEKARASSKPVALLVQKDTFAPYALKAKAASLSSLTRERAIQLVLDHAAHHERHAVLSTTGKISRELYETRINRGEPAQDFLNVGSMGHLSSIALGVALMKPDTRVFCLDGDGAVLMHMGAMGVIGQSQARNLVHVVLNNAAHESVGGQPTVGGALDLPAIALACGYRQAMSVDSETELNEGLSQITLTDGPVLLDVRVALGSRDDLGRPTSTPAQNKQAFMDKLHG